MEGVDVLFVNRNKQPNHVSKVKSLSKKKIQITVNSLTARNCQHSTKRFFSQLFFSEIVVNFVYCYTSKNWWSFAKCKTNSK